MSENAKNVIGMFEHQASGCFWYRTKHLLDLFNKNSIDARLLNLDTDVDFYDRLRSVQLYGIYPFSFEKVLKTLKEDGIKIVYDMDDAVSLIDETNPFYYAVKKDAGSSLLILKYADHITVSTKVMADLLRTKTDKPITVIPNCFIKEEWTFERPSREGIRIGFAGSCTHIPDLIKIIPIIKTLQSKYNVKFLIMGFGKTTYEEWYRDFTYSSTEIAIAEMEKLNNLLLGITYEWVPYVDYVNYPATLTNMSLDIGLCPLTDTPFNRARSACKAMEYTLSGALALASDLPPYQDDKSSILIRDNWEEAIEFYIHNRKKLDAERMEHLQWLNEKRLIDTQLSTLKDIYLS